MEWINPHAWIHVGVKGPDGSVVTWMVEAGSPNSLFRRGFTRNSFVPRDRDCRRAIKPEHCLSAPAPPVCARGLVPLYTAPTALDARGTRRFQ